MVKKVSIWLTLEPLMYSRQRHLADISRALKRPHTTVRKQLEVFEKMGLVEKEVIGRQTFYRLKDSPLLIDYLTIVEKERLIKRCREELVLKEIADFFHRLGNPSIIFGSSIYSIKNAEDVDVLIVGKARKGSIKTFGNRLNLKFHVINVESKEEVNEALKNEITKKHLIIHGSEEWVRWMISSTGVSDRKK